MIPIFPSRFSSRSLLALSTVCGLSSFGTSTKIAQAAPALIAVAQAEPVGPAMQPQHFDLQYQAIFKAATPGATTVYIPFPPDNASQTVERFDLSADLPGGKLVSWSLEREAEYGNRFVKALVEDAPADGKLLLHYVVTRRELRNPLVGAPPQTPATAPATRFLQPDRLVSLGEPISSLARETVKPNMNADARIRAIYEKTVGLMRYDKSGTGWGQGNIVFACDEKRGNCTDFHSMIIGMARTSKMAGKFEIGFPIPVDKAEGEISGYHCWAYLFHPQRGWIPLDASEGWKQERRYKDYYLGRIGSDRVAFSIGRDLKLGQQGEPLNYFIYPYAEQGAQTVAMQSRLLFKKLPIAEVTP